MDLPLAAIEYQIKIVTSNCWITYVESLRGEWHMEVILHNFNCPYDMVVDIKMHDSAMPNWFFTEKFLN